MCEQRVIVGMRELQAVDHMTNSRRLGSAEPIVLQIEIMNDRGNPGNGRLVNLEDTTQRFERAAVSLVAELDAEHIEWETIVRSGVAIGGESEPRLRIDEPANEPCRCHAIHTGAWSSNPQSSLIPFGVARPCSLRRRSGNVPPRCLFLEALHERCHAVAASAPEEVDPLDSCQPFSKHVQETSERRRTRAARPSAAGCALQDCLNVASQRCVRLLTGSSEVLDQAVVGPGIDVIGGEHARITACPFDLRLEPFEVFASIWCIR